VFDGQHDEEDMLELFNSDKHPMVFSGFWGFWKDLSDDERERFLSLETEEE